MDYLQEPFRSLKAHFSIVWKTCRADLAKEGKPFNRQTASDYFFRRRGQEDPFDLSDDIYFAALEEPTLSLRRDRMRRALAINPFEYDAKRDLIACLPVFEEKERLPHYLALKETIEKDLFSYIDPQGDNLYSDDRTRPYFRLLADIAFTYHAMKDYEKEQAIFERILELNEQDNQGVRYLLAAFYLSKGNQATFDALLSHYPAETMMDGYAYVDACLRKDKTKATALLKEIYEENPSLFLYFQVEDYLLLFLKPEEKENPDYYTLGKPSEKDAFLEGLYGYGKKEAFRKAIAQMAKQVLDPFGWLTGIDKNGLIDLSSLLFANQFRTYRSYEDFYQWDLEQAATYRSECKTKIALLSRAKIEKKDIEEFQARGFVEIKNNSLGLTEKGGLAAILASQKFDNDNRSRR